ncbi:TPA: hypothetical protein QDA71_001315 [Burkholderia vietnamiensis]|nr:hypothetical protein [Burkholderia vietnamiensis]HDR9206340.1 hypothetical protein [Burkholderia vietnamiensis]
MDAKLRYQIRQAEDGLERIAQNFHRSWEAGAASVALDVIERLKANAPHASPARGLEAAAFLSAWNLILSKCEFLTDEGSCCEGWRSAELEQAWSTVKRGVVSMLETASAADLDANRYRKARSDPDRRPAAWYDAGGRKIWGEELDDLLDAMEPGGAPDNSAKKAIAYAAVTKDRRFQIVWEPDTKPGQYRLYAGPNQCSDEYKQAFQEGHFDGYQDGWQARDELASNSDSFNPPEPQ